MRKFLLTILLVVTCLFSFSQSTGYIDGLYFFGSKTNNWWSGGKFNLLTMPTKPVTKGRDTGTVYYMMSQNALYIWNGSSYVKLSGGSYTSSNGITLSGSEFILGGNLSSNTTINGSFPFHSLTFDSMYNYTVKTINGFTVYYGNHGWLGNTGGNGYIAGPSDGSTYINLNSNSDITLGRGSLSYVFRNDSSSFNKKVSYSKNLGSTFSKYSLVDKNYVDSVVNNSGGSSGASGINRQFQFNNNGAFGGSAISYYENTDEPVQYKAAFGFAKYPNVNVYSPDKPNNYVWRFGTNMNSANGGKAVDSLAQWKLEFEHQWEGIAGIQSEFHLIHSNPNQGEIRFISINPNHNNTFTDWYFQNNIFRFTKYGDVDNSWLTFVRNAGVTNVDSGNVNIIISHPVKSDVIFQSPEASLGIQGGSGISFNSSGGMSLGSSTHGHINSILNGTLKLDGGDQTHIKSIYARRTQPIILNIGTSASVDPENAEFSPNALQINYYGDETGTPNTAIGEGAIILNNIRNSQKVSLHHEWDNFHIYSDYYSKKLFNLNENTAEVTFFGSIRTPYYATATNITLNDSRHTVNLTATG